ncbi:MAG: hypothetical protein QOJ65_946 [Fimbriimonadaceae bacterium]|nr:hypothetical protein [Fimbriimonadaceae bacterium]
MSALLLAALALGPATRPATDLTLYTLPIGFSAQLPKKPERTKPVKGIQSFWSESEAGVYVVTDTSVRELSKSDPPAPDQQLAQYLSGSIASSEGGRITEYHEILLNGWPGIEMKLDNPKVGATMWSRCYAIEDHVVEIATIYDTEKGPTEKASDVLDSLKQTGDCRCGPQSAAGLSFTNLEPEDAKIRIQFPGEPKEASTGNSSLHTYRFSRDMRVFSFTYGEVGEGAQDLSSSEAEEARDAVLDAVLTGMGVKPDSKATEQRDGNDWLTAHFHIENVAQGRIDILYLKGSLYTLIALAPEPWLDDPDFKRFFDSFEVKN